MEGGLTAKSGICEVIGWKMYFYPMVKEAWGRGSYPWGDKLGIPRWKVLTIGGLKKLSVERLVG